MATKDIAARVVREQGGGPLHYKKITEIALTTGLMVTTGATPHETLNAQLCTELANHPDTSELIRTAPGMWALRDPNAPPPVRGVVRQSSPRARPAPRGTTRANVGFDPQAEGRLVIARGTGSMWSLQHVADVLTAESVDWAVAPTVLDPVARAVRSVPSYRAPKGSVVRVEPLHVEQGTARFGLLTRRVVRESQEVEWHQFDTVEYTTAGGWTAPGTAEGRAFVGHATHWQNNLDYSWVRERVVGPGVRRLGAVPIGSGSGLSYVHGQADELVRLRRVARAFGAELDLITIGSDEDSRAAIGEQARQAFQDQISDCVSRIGDWREKARGRVSTMERLTEELLAIRDHARNLATVLGYSLAAIEESIAGALSDGTQPLDALAALADGFINENTCSDPTPPEPEPPVVAAPAEPAPATEPTPEVPSAEELETWKKPQIQAAAARHGIPLKDPVTKKARTALELASALSALRESPRA